MFDFNIRSFVEVDDHNRAVCPVCLRDKGSKFNKKNLSVTAEGAYHCHRCTHIYGKQFSQELFAELGISRDKPIPTALTRPPQGEIVVAKSASIQKSRGFGVTVSADQIREDYERLQQSKGKALNWLGRRGITPQIIEHYQLGVQRFQRGSDRQTFWGISIPIAAEEGGYYRKARIAPWITGADRPDYVEDWYQKGISKQVFFTWNPPSAEETYLCEGEWDAIALGWQMRSHPQGSKIAVASFTCGCSSVPDDPELRKLPGLVTIFYDRNDEPTKDGRRPGEEGAKKVAQALGDRARVGLVPQLDEHENIKGWDISDALNAGFNVQDLIEAAAQAIAAPLPDRPPNSLRDRLITFKELYDRTSDVQEWLVPGLLTSNELFIIAAGPRQGKSLIGLTLAHAVATGGNFLGRPVPQGKIIYANLEDSDLKIKERLQSQGWSKNAMGEAYALDSFKLSELNQLAELIQEFKPRLVVLDTLSRIRDDRFSEDKAEIGKMLEPLQDLAKAEDCCIIVIHHTTKVTVENADSVDVFASMRGSGSIRATARGSWILAATPGGVGHRLFVEHGWGKEDLRVYLDENTLEWKSVNEWQPKVDDDQRQRVLQYLEIVQQTTVMQASADCSLPPRSVGTILSSLHGQGLLEVKKNTGRGRIAAIYIFKSIYLELKQIEADLKHGTLEDTGGVALLQENGASREKDHIRTSAHSNVSDVRMSDTSDIDSNYPQNSQNSIQANNTSASNSFNLSQNFSSASNPHTEDTKPLKVGSKCIARYPDIYGVPSDKELTIRRIDDNVATVDYSGCRSISGVDVPLDLLKPL